jgi:two-component system chemotaxis response regulator CheB
MVIKNVLVVDDSAVTRGMISKIVDEIDNAEVTSSASNGQLAVDMYKRRKADVVILDIEMPVKNGIDALKEIIEFDPEAKVIMCSTLTQKNAEISLEALKLGALDYVPKPSSASEMGNETFKHSLEQLIKSVTTHQSTTHKNSSTKENTKSNPSSVPTSMQGSYELRKKPTENWAPQILAIGSSTGGPQALLQIMKDLKNLPVPIVITQHMPATFTSILSQHITTQAGVECIEGTEGLVLEAGKAYLAPGGKHLTFNKTDDGILQIKLNDGPMENFCKPAVDPMLRSLISHLDNKILCMILTGMGHDGLEGCKQLTTAGGYVYAQDAETSIVWGMPGAVAKAGLCSDVLPIDKISKHIRNLIEK